MENPDHPLRESLPEWAQLTLGWLVGVLRSIFGPLDEYLSGLSPEVGRWCATTLFAIAVIWVFTLKKDYVYLGAADRAAWRDLRLWTAFALLPYAFIYLLFF